MINRKVTLIEVGPRDGLQNIQEFIPTKIKLELIHRIIVSGVRDIQITSFVKETAVPQMRDAKEIATYCLSEYPEINLSALTMNRHGVSIAIGCGVKDLSYVICASELHNLKNARRSHEQAFQELKDSLESCHDISFTLDIGSAFGFYGDPVSLEQLIAFMERAYEIGIRKFNLCDSVGLAYPGMVRERVKGVLKRFPDCMFDIHIHDTRNMGIINTYTAIECGISRVQTSIGGLGGCPFAPGASGNTPSEDLLYMLDKMKVDTGVSFEQFLDAAKWAHDKIPGSFSGHIVMIDLDRVNEQ